jgi:hypothetical protein
VLAGRGVLVAGAAERVEAVVPDRARREGEPRPRSPGARERLLHEVLGVLERPDHAVAVRLELTAVALEERGEGGLVDVHHL